MPSDVPFTARWGIKIQSSMEQQCICARCGQPGGISSTEMLGVLFLAGMHFIIICVVLLTLVSTTFNQAPVTGDLHTEPSREDGQDSQFERRTYPRQSTPMNGQRAPSPNFDQSILRRVSFREEHQHDVSFLSRDSNEHNLSTRISPSAGLSLETNATSRFRNRSFHYETNGSAFPGHNTPVSDNGGMPLEFHLSLLDTAHRQNARLQNASRFQAQRRRSVTQPTEYWL